MRNWRDCAAFKVATEGVAPTRETAGLSVWTFWIFAREFSSRRRALPIVHEELSGVREWRIVIFHADHGPPAAGLRPVLRNFPSSGCSAVDFAPQKLFTPVVRHSLSWLESSPSFHAAGKLSHDEPDHRPSSEPTLAA